MPRKTRDTFYNKLKVNTIYASNGTIIGGGGGGGGGTIINNLDDIEDVYKINPNDFDVLTYIGTDWSNKPLLLDNLSNVYINTPIDNDILIYSNGNWSNSATLDVPEQLSSLLNVNETTPQDFNILAYSNGEWFNKILPIGELDGVTITNPQNDEVLTYNGSIWTNLPLPTIPTQLGQLANVNEDTPTEFNVLLYSNGGWYNKDLPIEELDGLTLDAPVDFNVLTYSNSTWTNKFVDFNNLTGITLTNPQPNEVLTYNGSVWSNIPLPDIPAVLCNLDDVYQITPLENEVLTYVAGNWSNRPLPTVPAEIADLDNVFEVNLQNNDILTYVAGNWSNKPLPLVPSELADLNNVFEDNPQNFEVLGYSNGNWSNLSLSIEQLGSVSITAPGADEALVYDGANWTNTVVTSITSGYTGLYGGTITVDPPTEITFEIPLTDPISNNIVVEIIFYAYSSANFQTRHYEIFITPLEALNILLTSSSKDFTSPEVLDSPDIAIETGPPKTLNFTAKYITYNPLFASLNLASSVYLYGDAALGASRIVYSTTTNSFSLTASGYIGDNDKDGTNNLYITGQNNTYFNSIFNYTVADGTGNCALPSPPFYRFSVNIGGDIWRLTGTRITRTNQSLGSTSGGFNCTNITFTDFTEVKYRYGQSGEQTDAGGVNFGNLLDGNFTNTGGETAVSLTNFYYVDPGTPFPPGFTTFLKYRITTEPAAP